MTNLDLDTSTIIEMFRYMRPMGGRTEKRFIDRFLTPLGFQPDLYGNLHLQIGLSRRVLFSSHVDTVHKLDGMQGLLFDGTYLTTKKQNCLGADDTAGVWLMTEMVKAKIPGWYVIHFGEERGCIGSSSLATHKDYFTDTDIAIAFDRAGYNDIITHQMGRRTASDAFARSLADQLDMLYQPDSGGAYTDTNEYAHLVAECTNISVGYKNQHTSKEQQDVPFLIELRDALLKVDWDKLKVERDPTKVEFDEWDWWSGYRPRGGNTFRASRACSYEELIKQFPDVAMAILEAHGIYEDDFEREVEGFYGVPVSHYAA